MAVKIKGRQMLVEFQHIGTDFRVVEDHTTTTGHTYWKLQTKVTSESDWVDCELSYYSAHTLVQVMACAIKTMTEFHG